MKNFCVIVAATASTFGIGKNGDLPWKLVGDMAFFKRQTLATSAPTKKNVVIMGRKTWESLPAKFRPLAQRINVVLSRNPAVREELNLPDTVVVATSLEAALLKLSSEELRDEVDDVYVIGGESIYREAMFSKQCTKIYLTQVEADLQDLDTFFPLIPAHRFKQVLRSAPVVENGIKYRFTEYDSIPDDEEVGTTCAVPAVPVTSPTANVEEQQYLDIVRDILDHGVLRGDRTGTGTLSKFGVQMRFSLRNGVFPLLTTKKVFWRGVAEELLWFVNGCTNGKELSDKGIHIWDGNGSREFLDSRGLHNREEGDLGPVYGFQWRHFGAEYTDMHADYAGAGIDQLKECIQKIIKSPEDRRLIVTAWNPADLDKMALPPCHMFFQFYVANGELSCQMYQRSADMGLGVPFNIASYSLLTCLVAQVCGLKPGDFVHSIGDAHVYTNHVDALKEQIKRVPRAFPSIKINPAVVDIDGFQFSDFTIEGYNPDAAVKMKMAV